ncbi:helix-turn-helix domain-containing protein [Gallibacterium sp. AGMB14963]|uniref:helix-turn-helix domain-containing protein n=1 Tax=Gallibacterium faecale TaxID=3019086 RepID=UPI0022F18BCE|nr:helix-turn-helix domain-containing protein [Gallibacterium sp. AGMB14963]MDA3978802.1 helix-turn-helix domain-containing protein [Gallibacterium sp. AGMB14963]
MLKNESGKDMHPADIKAELEKRGLTLAILGVRNGLAKTTLRNAFDKSYPRGELIIAKAIDKDPKDIWPSRYKD